MKNKALQILLNYDVLEPKEISKNDFEYAKSKGYMFDNEKQTHDKAVEIAFREFCSCDKEQAVKILLAFDADVNRANHKGVTPLMSAAIKGILECVRILVEAGADVNATAKDGFSPLMFAAYYGNTEVVGYLLSQFADKNQTSKKGETALSIAQKKKLNAIEMILK